MPAEKNPPPRSGEPSKEAAGAGPAPSGGEAAGEGELVAFTMDTATGRIVKVEAVDPGGERHELTPEEAAFLARQGRSTLEDLVERAFEAGIGSVLDAGGDENGEAETEDESKLRRLILRPMIERSAARRLMSREALGRAILGTLVREASASRAQEPEAGAAPPPRSGARGSSRGRQQQH